MSYNQIEYTLRSLGVSTNQIPASNNSIQNLHQKKKMITKEVKVDTDNQQELIEKRTIKEQQKFSLRKNNFKQPNKDNDTPISVSSRQSHSFSKCLKKKLMSKVDHNHHNVLHIPRQSLCCNCKNSSNSEYFEITNHNKNRIDELENKIQLLQKQILDKNHNSISFKNPGPKQFSSESDISTQLFKEQRKFIHKCVQAIQKISRVQNPSLKFCWKFIKQAITQSHSTHYSSNRYFKSPSKQLNKSQTLISNIKNMLDVKHSSQIHKCISSLIMNQQILQRICQKVKIVMNIKHDCKSPSELLQYIQNRERKNK